MARSSIPPKKGSPQGARFQVTAAGPKEAARKVHGSIIPGGVYAHAIASRVGPLLGSVVDTQTSLDYAVDLVSRMAPRDPAEEMLVAQMLLAHARVMHLTSLANQQSNVESLRTIHEYADRASNTYRRLMLALLEYRQPPRSRDGFTAIKQANFANQQVVQNHENFRHTATNEQGMPSGPAETPALSAVAAGADIAESLGSPRATMEAIHRPAHARREVPVKTQRDQAR
jgi:hypothetical protein